MGSFIFGNLRVESIREYLLVDGARSMLVLMSLWVGGMAYLSSRFYKIKELIIFRMCVYSLRVLSSLFFLASN